MPTFAAKVNGEDVPLTEFNRALQVRENQYQTIYRSELPEDVRRELRRAVIDELVRDAALRQRVEEQGYRASTARIDEAIRDVAAFQVDGEYLGSARRRLARQSRFHAGDVRGVDRARASRSAICKTASSTRRS